MGYILLTVITYIASFPIAVYANRLSLGSCKSKFTLINEIKNPFWSLIMTNFWNGHYIALSATCSIPSSYIVEPSVQKKKKNSDKSYHGES